MALLVVGSVAFDSVKTPYGEAAEVLGGSATYCAVAASYFTDVRVVAVVGEDFGEEPMRLLRSRHIDVSAIEVAKGKTFRWSGVYSDDLNDRTTLATHLNVFESFQPRLRPDELLDRGEERLSEATAGGGGWARHQRLGGAASGR